MSLTRSEIEKLAAGFMSESNHALFCKTLALMDKAASALPQWVSVEERLPEDMLFVLVWMPQSECSHTAFRVGNEWFGTWGDKRIQRTRITHWMPLPAAPKGK